MSWTGSTRRARLPADWPRRRARILKRDPICYVCHVARSTEVDHVIPGDNHDDANLAGICHDCHARKSAREGNAARTPTPPRRRPTEAHPGRTR